jgi:hypothetical protein
MNMNALNINALLAIAAALLAASVSPVLALKPGETIDVGGWKVQHDAKPDGSFKHCTASMLYEDKSIVGFLGMTLKETAVFVVEPELSLTGGQKYQVKFHVDDGPVTTVEGVAGDATTLVFQIDDPAVVFTAIQKGQTMTIAAGGTSLDEPLTGSNDALGALAKCIQDATR